MKIVLDTVIFDSNWKPLVFPGSLSESSRSSSSEREWVIDMEADQQEALLPGANEDLQQSSTQMKEFLGDIIKSTKTGPPINTETADYWSEILRNGLDKTLRKEIIEKYPVTENCLGLRSPKVNQEVTVCISETVLRQDNFFAYIQQQIGAGLSAMVVPIETVLKNNENKQILKDMADSTKLLADVHHTISVHRRYLLSNHLDPAVRKVAEECPVNEWLFGDNFSQAIKSSQEIRKVGMGMKKADRYQSKTGYQGQYNSLNWKRPFQKKRKKKEEGYRSKKQEQDRSRGQFQGRPRRLQK